MSTGEVDDGPPSVVVAAHPDAPPAVAREVHAGAEEQGVPTASVVGPGDTGDTGDTGGAAAAARAAAARSRLEVGVGIGADGTVAVAHALVAGAVLTTPVGAGPDAHRRAGADAARIVTGLPLASAAQLP